MAAQTDTKYYYIMYQDNDTYDWKPLTSCFKIIRFLTRKECETYLNFLKDIGRIRRGSFIKSSMDM